MENSQDAPYKSLVSGLGITGLVLGILTLVISFIPCLGMYGMFSGVLAIIISVIALILAIKHGHSKDLIVAGLIMAAIGFTIAVVQANAAAEAVKIFKDIPKY